MSGSLLLDLLRFTSITTAVIFIRRLPRLFFLLGWFFGRGHLVLAHHVVTRLSNLELLLLVSLVLSHRRQSLRLTSLQLLVGLLLLPQLLLKLPNHLILHQQLPLLSSRLLPVCFPVNLVLRLDNLDSLLEVLLLLLELVDLPDQLDVLSHQAPVDFLVLLVGFRQFGLQLPHIVGELLTLALELNRGVHAVWGFLLDFFGDVLLIKPDDCFLEFFVVSDAVLRIVHLVPKLPLLVLLQLQRRGQLLLLHPQPRHSHAQVLNNQTQISSHFLEVFLFLLHLVRLQL